MPDTLSDSLSRYIEQFDQMWSPYVDIGSKENSFAYFALKREGQFVLVRGTLYLNIFKCIIPFTYFETDNIAFGNFRVSDVGLTEKAFIRAVLSGQIPTPNGILSFLPNGQSNRYGSQFIPFHEIGLQSQSRLTMLSIFGDENRDLIRQPDLDWELRSSATPYESLAEALGEYQPGILSGVNTIDIAVLNVGVVDQRSSVDGDKATIVVRTMLGAKSEKIAVGIASSTRGRRSFETAYLAPILLGPKRMGL